MTGFIVNVFPFRNRVSPKEAFEGLELGEGKPSRPVLRGPGGRKAAWLLGSQRGSLSTSGLPDNPRTGGVTGNKGAFLGIGRTESLCLKRGNHFVENALRKTFIKRSVTLQPSEEQGTTKHIDQQFWIGRRLQFS
jgi:hypothetical protein